MKKYQVQQTEMGDCGYSVVMTKRIADTDSLTRACQIAAKHPKALTGPTTHVLPARVIRTSDGQELVTTPGYRGRTVAEMDGTPVEYHSYAPIGAGERQPPAHDQGVPNAK